VSLDEPGLPTETTDSFDLSDGWLSVVLALCGDDTMDAVALADRSLIDDLPATDRGDSSRRKVLRQKCGAPVRRRRSLAVWLRELEPFVRAAAAAAERRAVSFGVVVERLGIEPLRKTECRYSTDRLRRAQRGSCHARRSVLRC
jgi:hypothetical protein